MLTLALDTSTSHGTVALGEGPEVLAECRFSIRADHSETVMPEVRRMLERCGRGPGELEAVAVGAGPGSFTGVRIAASLAKGLCAALGARLYAYSTLAVVAAASGHDRRVAVLLPARAEVVYAAAYESVWPLDARLGPLALPVGDLLGRLEDPAEWVFGGEGARLHRREVEGRGGRVLPRLHRAPRAAALLQLCEGQPGSGAVSDPGSWEPQYVRASGAERGV